MANDKVISRILGGLGNQLFCYAAARRMALVNNVELVIDDISGFVGDPYNRHYQLENFSIPCRKASYLERLNPFSRLLRYIMRYINSLRIFHKRSYIQQEFIDFDSRILDIKPKGNLYIDGLWQSEAYFKDVESTIRSDLQIKAPSDNLNVDMGARIQSGLSIAVHVRFFDAPDNDRANNAPGDYYVRAVEKMEKLVPDAHYFIFSDKPEAARACIRLPDERITCVSHNYGDENACSDLWLMSLCQHFIIANSTFSWWGAWLSNSTNKIIIAPGFEKRDGVSGWGFEGLLPDEWIKC